MISKMLINSRRWKQSAMQKAKDSERTLDTVDTQDSCDPTITNSCLSSLSSLSECGGPLETPPSTPERVCVLSRAPVAAVSVVEQQAPLSPLSLSLQASLSLSPQSDPALVSPQLRHSHHRRHTSLTDDDFNGLLYNSRGWAYDPSMPVSMPHHEREHNRALAALDFEKFIFRPTAPRLG